MSACEATPKHLLVAPSLHRLHDELPGMLAGESAADVRARFRPDAIRGDLDSLRPDVLAYYQSQVGAVCQWVVLRVGAPGAAAGPPRSPWAFRPCPWLLAGLMLPGVEAEGPPEDDDTRTLQSTRRT